MLVHPLKARLLSATLVLMTGIAALAQNSPTPLTYDGTVIDEDFDSLANSSNTLPPGFGFVESGSNANTSYAVNDGTLTAGDTYSFGVNGAADRALGSLQSGSLGSTFGLFLRNDTATTLKQFTVSYRGEQYRVGGSGLADRLDFSYSTSATTLNATTGFTDVDALDFSSPVTTGTARAVVAATPISATVTGVSVAPGATLVLRFVDFNVTGADDGLAIDDFVFSTPESGTSPTPVPSPTPIPTPSGPNSDAKISEYRLSGPGGASDEFIEIFNAKAVPLNVSGWSVAAGSVTVAIPANTTPIASRGHLLLANSGGYSLANYGGTGAAKGDVLYTGDIPDGTPLTLSDATGAPIDVVSSAGLPVPLSTSDNFAYVRRLDSGLPLDTDSDLNDFNLVDAQYPQGPNTATGASNGILRLGAPGPENLSSPISNNNLITFAPATAVPASVRTGSGNSGTLALRYVVTNKANSGRNVSALRFRVVAVTAGSTNAANSALADLRLVSSTVTGGTILPLLLQEPPAQPNGGGLNSSLNLSSLPGGGIAPGQAVTVELLFNVVQKGNYRFLLNFEPFSSDAAATGLPDDDNRLLGNPSGATVLDAGGTNKENLLVEHNAYALGYQKSQGEPRWVSWHLDGGDLGSSGRTGNFNSDPKLPADCRITDGDYSGSGYTRGHQCPSGDRTITTTLNAETFLMSNMVPQTASLNNGVWADFENYCRAQASSGNSELYIMSGGVGSLGRIAGGKVNIPASCWKVAVILPKGSSDISRITKSTRVLSILMPNSASVSGTYSNYYTTVDNIESMTGLDLLSNLPDDIENYLEASTTNR